MQPNSPLNRMLSFVMALVCFAHGGGLAFAVTIPRSPVGTSPASFSRVVAHLGTGGSVYMHMDPSRLTEYAENMAAIFEGIITAEAPRRERQEVTRIFAFVRSLITALGFAEIDGLGMSSVRMPEAYYHNRFVVTHAPGKNHGVIWRLFGGANNAQDALRLMPGATVYASYGRFDLAVLLSWVKDEVAASGIPEMHEAVFGGLQELRAQGIDLETLLASTSGEFGFAVTMAPSHAFPLPIPADEPMMLENPGFVLLLGVKDATLFDLFDAMLSAGVPVRRVDRDGSRMRILQEEIPAPFPVTPTMAFIGTHIVLGSTLELVEEVVALSGGSGMGLSGHEDVVALSRNLPAEFAGFSFVSPRLGRIAARVIGQVNDEMPEEEAAAGLMLGFFETMLARTYGFSTVTSTAEGFVTCANSGMDAYEWMLLKSMFSNVFLWSGLLMPAVSGARTKAQSTVVLSNLRQLYLACMMYAQDHEDVFPTDLADVTPDYIDMPMLLRLLHNPAVSDVPATLDAMDYAYFGAGLKLYMIEHPADTVLLAVPSPEQPGIVVLFADGHIDHAPFTSLVEAANALGWVIPASTLP